MIHWIKRTSQRGPRSKQPASPWRYARPVLEALEDRIAPATSLAAPTLLDPAAPALIASLASHYRHGQSGQLAVIISVTGWLSSGL